MIDLDTALARIASVAVPLGSEDVAIDDAHGRVLAAPVTAAIASPRTDVATMDGYAIRDDDGDGWRRVAGVSRPAIPADVALTPGWAVRIFTGAPMPGGADRVVPQEQAVREGDAVRFTTIDAARFVRRAGCDFDAGAVLLAAGTRLTPRALVAAAAADRATLCIWRQPRVAIVGTGDELTAPGNAAARAGAIPDSLAPALAALCRDGGAIVDHRARVPDDLPALRQAAAAAVAGRDLVIVTGGASVGEHDHAKAMFAGLTLLFAGVAIKPGKPVWCGKVGATLVLGLPGNPTSAMVTARLFLMPLLIGMAGQAPQIDWTPQVARAPFPAVGTREELVRARYAEGGLVPVGNQDSGAQGALHGADWLVRRPAGSGAVAIGEPVSAIAF